MGKEIDVIMPDEPGGGAFDSVYARDPSDCSEIAFELARWFSDNCSQYQMDEDDFAQMADELLESGECEFGDGAFVFRMPLD